MKSKYKILIFLLLAVILSVSAFSACKKDFTYSLSATQTEYEVLKGDNFALPTVTVKDNKGTTITSMHIVYSIKDPDNIDVVPLNLSFIALKDGIYTISASIKDNPAAPLKINVTVFAKKIQALTSFNLSLSGIITFEQSMDFEYILVINDNDKGTVKTGQNIFPFIPAGNSAVTIRATKTGFIDSETAAPKAVTKAAAVQDVSETDDKIFFTQKAGEIYNLYNMGELIAENINSGIDITGYFEENYNEFSVAVAATDSVMASNRSEPINYCCHPKINDLTVDTYGVVSFSFMAGYSYDLFIKPSGQEEIKAVTNITNDQTITEVIDNNLTVGVNEVYLKISSSNNDKNKILADAEKSAVFNITKLGTIENFAINGSVATFDPLQGATYELFIDGTYKAAIVSGDNFAKYITKKTGTTVSVAIKAVATEFGYWSGEIGTSKDYSFSGYTDDLFVAGTGTAITAGNAYEINSKLKGSGLTFTGIAGSKVTYNGTIDLLNHSAGVPIIKFHPTAVNGLYDITKLTVRLIDKDDSNNVITYSIYKIGDLFVEASYKTQSVTGIDANWGGYSLYNQRAGADVLNFFSLMFDPVTKTISDGNAARGLALTTLTGFENGAILEVEIAAAGGMSGVTITALNGVDTSLVVYNTQSKCKE